jgi:hypothetical protein
MFKITHADGHVEECLFLPMDLPLGAAVEYIRTPSAVALWKLRAYLKTANQFDRVETTVATGWDAVVREEWEYAADITRNGRLITAIQSALSLTDAQVDALFMAAGQIQG